MKVRAQISMILNLDKCIGCHTCSVTCKNVWTGREGVEYAWFNNVETKPGIGYPDDWEDQARWNGGWERKKNGKYAAENGRQVWCSGKDISPIPICRKSTIIMSRSPLIMSHLQKAPQMKATPTARPRSLITGERMEKINKGPNWEEILGGEFSKALQGLQFRKDRKGNLRAVRKYLHDVSAAIVRALSQPGLCCGRARRVRFTSVRKMALS